MRNATLLVALAATACSWTAPSDDAGHEAWVLQAIPAVLGRPPTSMAEVEVLASIAQQEGRNAVLDILFEDEAYVRYWTLVLLEDLRLDRGGTLATAESCYRPDASWTPGQVARHTHGLTPAEASARLAAYDGSSAQGTAPGVPAGGFPLSELVEAAVRTDRLDLAFVASMPVLGTSHLVPTVASEEGPARIRLRNRFLDRYLDRELECMACHNTGFSSTGPTSGWDRHYPVMDLDLDAAVFDFSDASGQPVDGRFGEHGVRILPLFRTDVLSTAGTHRPWGLSDACVSQRDAGGTTYQITPGAPMAPGSVAFAGFEAWGAHDFDVLDLSEAFRTGAKTLWSHQVVPYVPVSANLPPDNTDPLSCPSCHVAGGMAFDASVFAEVPDRVLIAALSSTTNGMAPYYTSADPLQDVANLRAVVPFQGRDTIDDPSHGLAFLLANTIGNHIVDALSGRPFTVLHHQPRNLPQAELTAELTGVLLANQFALEPVLRHVLDSDAFNRRDVATSPLVTSISDAYHLPPVFDPFAERDPAESPGPDGTHNSIGDAVHVGSPTWRTQKVHHALGWESYWDSDGTGYPSDALMTALGDYENAVSPGFDGVHVGSMLAWEETYGACASSAVDYVTQLDQHALSHGLTNAQAARLLKERLISDPDLETAALPGASQSEWAALDGLFGGQLADPYTWGNEWRLRAYCGALLASPQFQLVGLATPRDPVAAASVELDKSFPPRVGYETSRSVCEGLGRFWSSGTRVCSSAPE